MLFQLGLRSPTKITHGNRDHTRSAVWEWMLNDFSKLSAAISPNLNLCVSGSNLILNYFFFLSTYKNSFLIAAATACSKHD